jgi:hypothetical protein
MKIGIIGAPGVGKTKFANELREELARTDGSVPVVLDDYVEDLRNSTGLAYGDFGDFIDDLQVAFKRREWELLWYQTSKSTITCGTVLDSVVHNFIRESETVSDRYEVGVQTQRLQAIAHTFSLIYSNSWDYDYAFYLPSDDRIGKGLQELITAWHAPVFSFNPEVSDDEKASVAAKTIRTLEAEPASEVDQRGVRPSGESGEEDGDSAEPVPDVPEREEHLTTPDGGEYYGREYGTYKLDGEVHPCDCDEQIALRKHYLLANIGDQYMRLNWHKTTATRK